MTLGYLVYFYLVLVGRLDRMHNRQPGGRPYQNQSQPQDTTPLAQFHGEIRWQAIKNSFHSKLRYVVIRLYLGTQVQSITDAPTNLNLQLRIKKQFAYTCSEMSTD